MDEENEKLKHPKTSRALDWLAACFIRLPAVIILAAIIIAVTFVVTLIVAPDKAQAAWEFIKEIFKK